MADSEVSDARFFLPGKIAVNTITTSPWDSLEWNFNVFSMFSSFVDIVVEVWTTYVLKEYFISRNKGYRRGRQHTSQNLGRLIWLLALSNVWSDICQTAACSNGWETNNPYHDVKQALCGMSCVYPLGDFKGGELILWEFTSHHSATTWGFVLLPSSCSNSVGRETYCSNWDLSSWGFGPRLLSVHQC